jgi:DivIVA domain-containing protein
VDRDSIDRIRSATFPIGRKGYEKREVDRFLNALADWLETGGGDQVRAELVRGELERVGERTAQVLTEAHDAAEKLRADAEREAHTVTETAAAEAEQTRTDADRYASGVRGEADAYGERTRIEVEQYATETREEADADAARARQEADEYSTDTRHQADLAAEQVRVKAERDAENRIAAAETKARALIDEADRHQTEAETAVHALEQRRDHVIADMERLSSELTGTATQHRSVPQQGPEPAGDGDQPPEPASQPRRTAAPTRNGS